MSSQRISFRQRAGENIRYAPGAFDGQIGKTIILNMDDWSGPATLLGVAVVDDGQALFITVDVEGMPSEAVVKALTGGRIESSGTLPAE